MDDFLSPLKLLAALTTLYHDTATEPTNANLIDKAQKLTFTILDGLEDGLATKEYLESSLHDLSVLMFLLTITEQERADILASCDFLVVEGSSHAN